jgi:hypothetical protein
MLFPALFLCLSWVSRGTGEAPRRWPRAKPPALRRPYRPRLDILEDRTLPSSYTALTASDLIADINAANSAGGANTITLTAPTTSPYVLTAADNSTDGATGLPVVAKHDTLTIVGNGDTVERSTASGTPAFRLFDVASAASLTLQNLTLQNGLAFGSGAPADGGAIYNQGALVLSAVTAQSNTAQGSNGPSGKDFKINNSAGADASGGAVWSGSSLTLENGTLVQNNHAIGGTGGENDSISNGRAGPGGNAFGAGVFLAGGTGTFTGVTVDNNVAVGGPGGAAFTGTGTAYAKAGNGSGGGVYIAAGTVTLSSDTVDGNQAEGGTNPGFAGNDGYAYGGGIYLAAGTVTLSNDTVSANSAAVPAGDFDLLQAVGGGIYIASNATATLCNDTVESNSATSGSITVVNVTVGGGIYIASGGTVYIDTAAVDTVDPTVVANNTDGSGLNGTTANINGTYIPQNC